MQNMALEFDPRMGSERKLANANAVNRLQADQMEEPKQGQRPRKTIFWRFFQIAEVLRPGECADRPSRQIITILTGNLRATG